MKAHPVTGLAAIVVVAAFVFAPSRARATGPVDVEIGAKLGFGTNPSSSPINPFGFGYGARAGVAVSGFYGGLNVMHYTANSSANTGGDTQRADLQLGAEAGYGFKVALLTIRPLIGIGNVFFSNSVACALSGGTGTDSCGGPYVPSFGGFYLEPGVTAFVTLAFLYVGADINALILPGATTYALLTTHGQVGVKF